jgi:hypothetical protein
MPGSALISWMAVYRANISSVVTQIRLWPNSPIGSPARRNTVTAETPSSSSRLGSVPESRKRFVMASGHQMSIHRRALGPTSLTTSRDVSSVWVFLLTAHRLALHTFSLLAIASTFTGRRRQSARRRRHHRSSISRKGRSHTGVGSWQLAVVERPFVSNSSVVTAERIPATPSAGTPFGASTLPSPRLCQKNVRLPECQARAGWVIHMSEMLPNCGTKWTETSSEEILQSRTSIPNHGE